MPLIPYAQRILVASTGGGRGSFSYADTKVYGTPQPVTIWLPRSYQINTNTGEVVWKQETTGSALIVPGGGGGAKAPGKRYYGSRAVGFKPDGMVLLRLMKLD
jgi:hypothetical protein